MSQNELVGLAHRWRIPIFDHQLSARSLLNRDAEGTFKFAHRSIMEYLFVQRFLHNDMECLTVEWTDQMKTFMWEKLQNDTRQRPDPYQKNRYQLSVPAFSSEDKAIEFLGMILAFAAQSSDKLDLGIVTTQTMLLLCALILDRKGAREVSLTLWDSFGEQQGKGILNSLEKTIGAETCTIYDLRCDRGLSYFNNFLNLDHEAHHRIMFPSRPVLLDVSPLISDTDQDVAVAEVNQEIERALLEDRQYGTLLIVPIFLRMRLPFALVARSDGRPFTREQAALLSKVFALIEMQVPS